MFGAGAVLYFALSNTLPFPGKTLKKASGLHDACRFCRSLLFFALQFHGCDDPYLSFNLQLFRHAPR